MHPFSQYNNTRLKFSQKGERRICFQICKSSLDTDKSQIGDLDKQEDKMKDENNGGGGGGNPTSFLILVLWGGLMYYVFNLAPNQTPVTFFLQL